MIKKKKIYGNPSPFLLESIIKHPSPLNFVLYIMFEPGYSKWIIEKEYFENIYILYIKMINHNKFVMVG